MCKGEAHGEFEQRMMPADSNLLNLLWQCQVFPDQGGGILQKPVGGYRCGCDAQPHAVVLASHPRFSKWREIFEAKFWHLQALNLWLAAFGWGQKLAKRGRVGSGWTGFPDKQNWLVSLMDTVRWCSRWWSGAREQCIWKATAGHPCLAYNCIADVIGSSSKLKQQQWPVFVVLFYLPSTPYTLNRTEPERLKTIARLLSNLWRACNLTWFSPCLTSPVD